jgi:hypothetical protein
MKLAMVRQGFCLVPADDESMEKFKKLKKADVHSCDVKEYHNYEFHKKMFALFNIAFENQDKHKTLDESRAVLTVEAGYGIPVISESGTRYYIAKSLAYDKMEQSEKEELYSKVLDQVVLMIGSDKETLLRELGTFL